MPEKVRDSKGGILSKEQIALQREPVSVPCAPIPRPKTAAKGAGQEGQSELTVLRADDGTIQSITVRCPCGREIHLQCEYPENGGQDEKTGS